MTIIEDNKICKHYKSIDGLRAISCLAIIAMHIKANSAYLIDGFLYNTVIPSFTFLVYLFIMISGFGMCTGYLAKFQENMVDLELFYKRRYGKILPFFSFLILIALIVEPSIANFYEASVELTLLYGLLPNNSLNVLGVCWTLGVIFLFYLLFPAFTILMKSKKRAWTVLLISLWLNFVCQNYFFGEDYVIRSFTPRHCFIYCIPFFIGGGIIYLYKETIRKICSRFRFLVLIFCIGSTMLYFVITDKIGTIDISFYVLLLIFMCWLSYAVGVDSRFLSCKAMYYLSSISMEMYLAQMVIFRGIEKCNLLYMLGNGWLGYIVVLGLTILGLIIFIEGYYFILRKLKRIWMERMIKI